MTGVTKSDSNPGEFKLTYFSRTAYYHSESYFLIGHTLSTAEAGWSYTATNILVNLT